MIDGTMKRRRLELGAFLRGRRAGLQPDDVGIAAIGRRHVKGLRREEVAAASSIGVSWYTMLEQGRVDRVTTRTLNAIADALRLSIVERAHLRKLAAASFEELAIDHRSPPESLLRYVTAYPTGGAILHTSRFDIVAASRWSEAFFGFSAALQPNLLEHMIRSHAMQARFIEPNWFDTLRLMVGHFRLSFANYGDDQHASLADRLCAESPEFQQIWTSERLVHAPPTDHALIDHPQEGRIDSVLIAFTPASCPSYTVVLNHAAIE